MPLICFMFVSKERLSGEWPDPGRLLQRGSVTFRAQAGVELE